MSDLLTKCVMQAGEFQCYDQRALASLAEAAAAVEQAEWGKEGPHDAGEYNSWPEVCLPDAADAHAAALLRLYTVAAYAALLLFGKALPYLMTRCCCCCYCCCFYCWCCDG
jgi:hypothetical protein